MCDRAGRTHTAAETVTAPPGVIWIYLTSIISARKGAFLEVPSLYL